MEKTSRCPIFATFIFLRALPHQFLPKISYCVANFILGNSSVAVILIHKKQKVTKSTFFNLEKGYLKAVKGGSGNHRR
jgi:hypothetical protein